MSSQPDQAVIDASPSTDLTSERAIIQASTEFCEVYAGLEPDHFSAKVYRDAYRRLLKLSELAEQSGRKWTQPEAKMALRGVLDGIYWNALRETRAPFREYVKQYVDQVIRLARIRHARVDADAYVGALFDNDSARASEHLDALRDAMDSSGSSDDDARHPADFSEIVNPEAGQTKWLIEDFVPEASLILLAAGWKTGKTLLIYAAIADAMNGRKVLGQFPLAHDDLRVQLWQFEMPLPESVRRFRKLYLGAGLDPAILLEQTAQGRFQAFVQPDLDLADPDDQATFRAKAGAFKPHLVVIDSAGECGFSMNDNTDVRRQLKACFNPMLREGISILLLHHKRKGQPGKQDDERDSILGAQSWAAKSSRIYTLERIGQEDEPGDFVVRLGSQRGWDKTQVREAHFHVHDEIDAGEETTLVEAMSPQEIQTTGVERELDRAIRIIVEEAARLQADLPPRHGELLSRCTERHGLSKATFNRAYKSTIEGKLLKPVNDPDDKRITRVVLGPKAEVENER
jgi:hypothetical protein